MMTNLNNYVGYPPNYWKFPATKTYKIVISFYCLKERTSAHFSIDRDCGINGYSLPVVEALTNARR